jgi:HK97 family phage major capsid protein
MADYLAQIREANTVARTAAEERDAAKAELAKAKEEAAVLKAKIERTPVSGQYDPTFNPNGVTNRLPAEVNDNPVEKTFGFKSFQHFLHEVRGCSPSNPSEFIRKAYDSEVVRKAATGMGELVGSDGGFLVPPQFSSTILERMYRSDDLLARTDQYTTGSNVMVFPRNAETSRATGSRWGGARAYWVEEGSTITPSSPTFGRATLKLNKLACLVRMTEELIQDSSNSMPNYATRVFAMEIGFAAGNAIFRGTGAGQPLGILNSPCVVQVTKETGQAAATIVPQNIAKMWARRFALGPTGNYVWLINQDVGPQLFLLSLAIGTAGMVVYMPPGGLSSAPFATLMGAPIIQIEYASTLGTVGDIVLADLSQVISLTKPGGLVSSQSIHIYFVTDEEAYKTTFRLDAQPWQSAALTPFQGTNTQAPFITLQTR